MSKMVNRGTTKSLLFLLIVGLIFSSLFVAVVAKPNPRSAESLVEEAPDRSDYPDSDGVIMLDQGLVTVDKGGKKTVVVSRRMKVFSKEGRQKYGEVTIPYISESGEPKLNYIRTITPDGEVVKPDKEDIRDITPARLQQYPMYSDVKNKVISMPGLTNGAIIDYSYTVKPKRFFLKEDFSSSWLFRSKLPTEVSHFQVTVPDGMKLEWTDFDSEFSPQVTEQDGQKVFTWKRTNLEKITEEPGMPPINQISGRVLVTSIDSWEYYAKEFWDLAKTQMKPDSDIRQKVQELTKGLTSKEEKVRALYNYVATKVRYVAIELGRSKYKPHKAKEVFHNKYGDCKDKAILLISMLKVAGIQAHPVLILSGHSSKTDFNQPPPGKGLNHAIVAVELNDEYKVLDPTCDVCPYEYLPNSDRGKKALLINRSTKEVGQILDMKKFDPKASKITVNQSFELNENGDLSTDVQLSYQGFTVTI